MFVFLLHVGQCEGRYILDIICVVIIAIQTIQASLLR